MKQDCLLCERTSPDNNLYCQETYCPAEMSPTVLEHGEWLGNVEIVKPIMVLRSSVLYEARHQNTKVLLKVAHPGPENRERLKREAEFLQKLGREAAGACLPTLLPPYTDARASNEPYGRVVLRGHLLYYCLYEHFAGEPLRDVLTQNLQLWVYHIGWIIVRLASAVAFVQSRGVFHYALSPDCVLVRLNDPSGGPRVLLFDLGIAGDREQLAAVWYPFLVHPAYTAPELIGGPAAVPQPSYTTDVYGLGLTLYEMLIGAPAFPFRLGNDRETYEAVRHGRRAPMTRSQDVKLAAEIALQAVDVSPAARYASAAELLQRLHECFGDVPERDRRLNVRMALLVGGAILAIVLLIVVTAISI